MNNISIIVTIFLQIVTINAFGDLYEKKLIDSHIIHVVRLNSNDYIAEIVKSNDGCVGRETVLSLAKRTNADIAINGGFFEIGDSKDGMPSGTLVINAKEYNLKEGIQPLLIIQSGIISIALTEARNYRHSNISLVSGIPLLINSGKISENLFNKKSDFYLNPHARTALGIDSRGNVIIVIAEHYYTKDITTITLGELQSFIKTKGVSLTKKYNKENPGDITLNELKEILKDEYAPKNIGAQGLTILELAKLMKDLGCEDAINLDGGGSSTLWINGKVVNNIFGDKDENIGEKSERSVSDAIIFKKIKK